MGYSYFAVCLDCHQYLELDKYEPLIGLGHRPPEQMTRLQVSEELGGCLDADNSLFPINDAMAVRTYRLLWFLLQHPNHRLSLRYEDDFDLADPTGWIEADWTETLPD